jgi:transcription elongation GreA/GreB family factor
MRILNKHQLLERIVSHLEQELQMLKQAARSSAEAASLEERRAESLNESLGAEASYLADAQIKRAFELEQLIRTFRALPIKEFKSKDPIDVSALVELDSDGKRGLFFIADEGGGVSVTVGSKVVQVITPRAPLGEELLGKKVGDVVEIDARESTREYEVTAVA